MSVNQVSAVAAAVPSRPGSTPFPKRAATPAEPFLVEFYCEDCFEPCGMTDRGPLCARHYVDRTPLCDLCGEEHSVVLEGGKRVCLTKRCLANASRSDDELARIADEVDRQASVLSAALLIMMADEAAGIR